MPLTVERTCSLCGATFNKVVGSLQSECNRCILDKPLVFDDEDGRIDIHNNESDSMYRYD